MEEDNQKKYEEKRKRWEYRPNVLASQMYESISLDSLLEKAERRASKEELQELTAQGDAE